MQITDGTDKRIFKVGDSVKFTDEYLDKFDDKRKRYFGRTGKVTGYRMGAEDPIVFFEKDGRRKEQKLFEVQSNNLKLVPQ